MSNLDDDAQASADAACDAKYEALDRRETIKDLVSLFNQDASIYGDKRLTAKQFGQIVEAWENESGS